MRTADWRGGQPKSSEVTEPEESQKTSDARADRGRGGTHRRCVFRVRAVGPDLGHHGLPSAGMIAVCYWASLGALWVLRHAPH